MSTPFPRHSAGHCGLDTHRLEALQHHRTRWSTLRAPDVLSRRPVDIHNAVIPRVAEPCRRGSGFFERGARWPGQALRIPDHDVRARVACSVQPEIVRCSDLERETV